MLEKMKIISFISDILKANLNVSIKVFVRQASRLSGILTVPSINIMI